MGNEVSRIDYAEPHPILFKDSERREQKQTGNEVSQIDSAELHPIFAHSAKIRISRVQKQIYLQFCRGGVSKM